MPRGKPRHYYTITYKGEKELPTIKKVGKETWSSILSTLKEEKRPLDIDEVKFLTNWGRETVRLTLKQMTNDGYTELIRERGW